jgi:yecA family protein
MHGLPAWQCPYHEVVCVEDVALPAHAELEDALQAAGAECGAAESHGLVCGMVCAAGSAAKRGWLEHLLGEGNTLSAAARAAADMLATLYAATLLKLDDGDLDLALLLPDDDVPLAMRSQALGQWCQGFLYGLALGGVRDDSSKPGNVSEIMHDFFEISNTRYDYETSEESEEAAYFEIVEYVRMSVLLCHEELQPVQAAPRLQ